MTGKVALVTGGSRGIGLATAVALAARGAAVAVTATSDDGLASAAAELERTAPGSCLTLRADVRSAADMASACKAAVAKFGGLDVSDARRLKALEDENGKLKKLLAETMLDIAILKDINSRKW